MANAERTSHLSIFLPTGFAPDGFCLDRRNLQFEISSKKRRPRKLLGRRWGRS